MEGKILYEIWSALVKFSELSPCVHDICSLLTQETKIFSTYKMEIQLQAYEVVEYEISQMDF